MIKPTGACTAGVKVRITRQRMVGKIARHSGADTAAGVTPGRPWHSTGRPGKFSRRALGQFRTSAGVPIPPFVRLKLPYIGHSKIGAGRRLRSERPSMSIEHPAP